MRPRCSSIPIRRICPVAEIDAEFTPDMSKFSRVRQAAVGHHDAQGRDARLGEERLWWSAFIIQTQQTLVEQTPRGRGYFRLSGKGPAAPGFEVKAIGDTWRRREEHVEFPADVVALTGREAPGGLVPCFAHRRSITRRHAWVRGTRSIAIRGISTGGMRLTATSAVRSVDRHARRAWIGPGATGVIMRRLMPPDAVSTYPNHAKRHAWRTRPRIAALQ
jgi:hypothetical protein